jgi:hypothetical protein
VVVERDRGCAPQRLVEGGESAAELAEEVGGDTAHRHERQGAGLVPGPGDLRLGRELDGSSSRDEEPCGVTRWVGHVHDGSGDR